MNNHIWAVVVVPVLSLVGAARARMEEIVAPSINPTMSRTVMGNPPPRRHDHPKGESRDPCC